MGGHTQSACFGPPRRVLDIGSCISQEPFLALYPVVQALLCQCFSPQHHVVACMWPWTSCIIDAALPANIPELASVVVAVPLAGCWELPSDCEHATDYAVCMPAMLQVDGNGQFRVVPCMFAWHHLSSAGCAVSEVSASSRVGLVFRPLDCTEDIRGSGHTFCTPLVTIFLFISAGWVCLVTAYVLCAFL